MLLQSECLSSATICCNHKPTERGNTQEKNEFWKKKSRKKSGNVITPTAEPVTTKTDVQEDEILLLKFVTLFVNAIGPLKISHNNNIIHSSTHRTHNDSKVHIAALPHKTHRSLVVVAKLYEQAQKGEWEKKSGSNNNALSRKNNNNNNNKNDMYICCSLFGRTVHIGMDV